jgi:7,8-dihydropterin-6-yl-methyl-4-(beta-D-ribofuranosyl)aminobenzene 5'-phosphate synthase
MKITILVDNHALEGLSCEHGFSMFIENGNNKILFDTGQLDSLQKNADKLGVDLSCIDTLVLSHGHYDHTGGVCYVLSKSPNAKVFINKSGFADRYSIRNNIPKNINIQSSSLEALQSLDNEQLVDTKRPTMIDENIGVTGYVPRKNNFEDTGGPFFLDKEGLIEDSIEDDMAMWIETDKGLVICVGCSHSGIINIINYIIEITGESNIHTLIGGLHLVNADDNRMKKTIEGLRTFNIKHLIPCHCTGEEGVKALLDELGSTITPGFAGFEHNV